MRVLLVSMSVLLLGSVAQAQNGRVFYTAEQKEWAIATSAVLTYVNRYDLGSLRGGTGSEVDVACQTATLRNSWGVVSRQDLLDVLGHLKENGHRSSMQDLQRQMEDWPLWCVRLYYSYKGKRVLEDRRIAFIKEHESELDEKSLTGWDLMRLVSVVRWGVTAGYLSEKEAWDWIMPAAQTLQSTFNGWSELGDDYQLGRQFWSKYRCWENSYEYDAAIFWLNSNPESPWFRLDWNLDLTGSPEPVENGTLRPTALYLKVHELFRDGEYNDGINLLRRSVEHDPARYKGLACLRLAGIYATGEMGVTADAALSRSFYEKGGEFNNQDCLLELGVLHHAGREYGKAMELFKQASAIGSVPALDNIGVLYLHGYGVEKDPHLAMEYFERALKAGSVSAEYNIASLMWLFPDFWNEDIAVRYARDGVRKCETDQHYDTLFSVLMKAERYPEALEVCTTWIAFYQKKENIFDDAVLPERFKKARKEVVSKIGQQRDG